MERAEDGITDILSDKGENKRRKCDFINVLMTQSVLPRARTSDTSLICDGR